MSASSETFPLPSSFAARTTINRGLAAMTDPFWRHSSDNDGPIADVFAGARRVKPAIREPRERSALSPAPAVDPSTGRRCPIECARRGPANWSKARTEAVSFWAIRADADDDRGLAEESRCFSHNRDSPRVPGSRGRGARDSWSRSASGRPRVAPIGGANSMQRARRAPQRICRRLPTNYGR